ncbi:hypothetical protein OIU76_020758 [Salix suchowensis]|nr:hypothetical protein OIU76_020758 [Salix suchowensis]
MFFDMLRFVFLDFVSSYDLKLRQHVSTQTIYIKDTLVYLFCVLLAASPANCLDLAFWVYYIAAIKTEALSLPFSFFIPSTAWHPIICS